jgi:hypothetical protein
MVSFALTQFKVKILFHHEEREKHEGFVISVFKPRGLRVLRGRFFSALHLAEEILASERDWEFPRRRYWNPAELSIT